MADSSVSVKMGVTGIAQFKTGMNQAKQSVKTLDAELALNEKQFKQTGDAQEYMQQKSELLKQKLEEQKKVVENAEKALEEMKARGVDQSSSAFQKMQLELAKAKGDLIDTENTLNGVAEAGDEAANGVSEMNSNLKRIGDGVNYQNVTDGLQKITDGMKNVINRAWNMGKAIVNATLGAGSWADELATTAAQYEIEPEHLYRMRETARLIDTDADTILAAQDKMRKGIEKAQKDPMGALAYLGVDPTDKGWDDIFWEAGEAIAQLADDEEKVAYSNALFGKSWRELMPLFQAGRGAYDETMGQWSWIGDDAFENLTKMDDAYQQLESEWDAFQKKFEAAMAPAMTQTMEVITGLLQEFNDYLSSEKGQEMLTALGDAVSGLFLDLTKIDPESVISGITGVIDQIQKALEWFSKEKNRKKVVGFIEAFIGAWAAMTVAKGATTVISLVNSINGLTAGQAASAGATAGSSWASAFATAAMKAAPFLAFLYTLLNPSSGSDELGNNDLVDANGNLTAEAKAYGYELDETGNPYIPGVPKHVQEQQEQKIREKRDTVYAGDTTDAIERNQRRLAGSGSLDRMKEASDKMAEAAEDLTGANTDAKKSTSEMATAAGTMKGLPGAMEAAIRSALSQMNIYLDGQSVGNVMTPYVSQGMGSVVKAITR